MVEPMDGIPMDSNHPDLDVYGIGWFGYLSSSIGTEVYIYIIYQMFPAI
jgi:hypothetical protein